MERYLIPGGETVKCVTAKEEILFVVTARDPVLGKFIGAAHHPFADGEKERTNRTIGREVRRIDAAISDGGLVEVASETATIGKIVSIGRRGICGQCCDLAKEAIRTRKAELGPAVLRNAVVGEIPIEITKIHENIFVFSYQGELCHGMSGSPILQDGALIGAHHSRNTKKENEGFGIHIEDMVAELLLGRPEKPIPEFGEG